MKKLLFITLGLAAVFSLTSCVENQQVNPNFDPNTNTVNTQFVLNIAAVDENPQTKQTPYNAQIEGFLGIDNATLFTFQLDGGDGQKVLNPGKGQAFDLSTVLGSGTISESNSKRVLELPLPLGANAMIFYGMSIKGTRSDEMAGLTSYIYPDDNISHIGSFAVPRLIPGSTAELSYTRTKSYMLSVLNGMLRLGLGGSGTSKIDNTPITTPGYTTKTVHWQDYLDAVAETGAHSPLDENHSPGSLEIILGNTYKSLTEIADSEARGGSGSAIGGQMRDLMYLCEQAEGTTVTANVDNVAKEFFAVLKQYIVTFFNNDQWKTPGELTDGFVTWGISGAGTEPTGGNFNHFPQSFNLPVGSAVLQIEADGTGQKKYVFATTPSAVQQPNTITDITYPPQLCYYCNSPLRISDSDNLNDQTNTYPGYPNGVTNWSDASKWTSAYGWGSGYGHITTTTRGVALAFNVQYGQAVLATQVYYDSNIVKDNNYVFKDNNASIPGHSGQTDQEIKVSVGGSNGFVLTGILIGGQPSVANWQYLPWSTVATDLAQVARPVDWVGDWPPAFNMNKMVYDSYISPQNYPSTSSTKIGTLLPMAAGDYNYTVVHDNYNPGSDGQQDVYVALEMMNMTGQDFWGQDNLVRAGASFYLPMTLKVPSEWPSTIPLTSDEDNMMPPYNSNGKTIQDPRVFMADTQTTLKVKLTQDALKCAMVTIPDLRTAKMSFGLSIDLNWKAGKIYNVNIEPTTTTNP